VGIAVVVPWGRPIGYAGDVRQAVWDICRKRWESSTLVDTLIIAADPLFAETGKFSVARATNNAVRHAPPSIDKFFCIGADAVPTPRAVHWADHRLDDEPWTLLYDHGAELSKEDTALLVSWKATPAPVAPPETYKHPTPTVGPIAFTRRAWEAVGGYDEAYEGWAYEDVDFWRRLTARVPSTTPDVASDEPLIQFWHPVDHHNLDPLTNPNVAHYRDVWES
jgi:N-terminal domain of galactosyltransferase